MAVTGRSFPSFLRDAVVAAVVASLVLAPALTHVGPEFLRYPGYLLYFPLLVI
jgi:hypothetical protein